MRNERVILWDFDGTLGYRDGGMWSATLHEILGRELPELAIPLDHVRPHMQSGFFWDNHETAHPELADADVWWRELQPLFDRAFRALGVPVLDVPRLSAQVREVYTHLPRWRVFEDTLPAMETLTAAGWRHRIVSNHVPELQSILSHLELAPRVELVSNSAVTGYEKPHPEAFRAAMRGLSARASVVVIGDNAKADVEGARRLGLPALLVRKPPVDGVPHCADLKTVPAALQRLLPLNRES